jgi:hypothetical protein
MSRKKKGKAMAVRELMRPWVVLAWIACVAGCGGGAASTREPDEYTGCGTDEHWRTFDDQEPAAKVDDSLAPAMTAPVGGATVPFDPKLELTWQQYPGSAGSATGDVDTSCPQFALGGLTPQHLPPISGDVYDLQFSVAGSVVWRVITTLQEWSADDKLGTWASFRGKTVSLKAWRLPVLRNDPKDGPFVAAHPFVFSVAN